VNENAGVGTPEAAWKRVREVRAEVFVEFERWAGKSVDQVIGRKK
jgi:hypothetical protein